MRVSLRVSLCLAVVLLLPAGVEAQTLFGISYSGSDGLSTLHTINPATGAATAVGPIGFQRCGGMDFDGVAMFATCERNDGSDTPVLVRIDLTTGVGTEVGPTGFTGAIGDISFRSDGVLFAYDAANDPDHSLITISRTTGAGTLVGDTGLQFAGGNGMTFNAAGTLFHSQFANGPNSNLNTLNTATGAPTLVGQIASLTGRLTAMDVDPLTGTIYGIHNEGSGGVGPNSLVTIDPAGPTATTIGATANGMDALAFGSVPPPIPALGLSGLLALMLVLGVAGAWMISGRT